MALYSMRRINPSTLCVIHHTLIKSNQLMYCVNSGGATASSCNTNPLNMTAEEYFDENFDKEGIKNSGFDI